MGDACHYIAWNLFLSAVGSTITAGPRNIQVLEGRTAVFTCSAVAEPIPTFHWELNGTILTDPEKYSISSVDDATSMLTINSVSLSDAGEYTCIAINDHGNDSAAADLQVLSKFRCNILCVCVHMSSTHLLLCMFF